MTIALPVNAYEENLPGLIVNLGKADDADPIVLDFEPVRFFTPGAIVLVLAKVKSWLSRGKKVFFQYYKTCGAFRYLQRIDFFAQSGIELAEDFQRHETGGRFVVVHRIGGPAADSVEELSTGIAECIFPDADVDDPEESGLFDLIQYSVSELALNVTQHARATGFAMAQHAGRTDLIRVAIADHGIGIARSFIENGSPHWREGMNDADAIELALRPKVSSKGHLTTPWGESINAGVGLTLLKGIAERTNGNLFIASGSGVYWRKGNSTVQPLKTITGCFPGTVCSVAFTRSQVQSFPRLMHEAKRATGLLPEGTDLGNFFT